MREITTKGKMVMDKKIIVKIEKSGNRYNAWDADGVKHTSSIGTSTRKKAYMAGMALERRTGKAGRWSLL